MKRVGNKFFVLLPVFLLFALTALAQAPSKKSSYLFKGKLIDADSSVAVSHAHIKNPYKSTVVVSDANGGFLMPVEGGDTLLITRIGYISQKYVVAATEPEGVTAIMLQPKTEELKEVVITKFPSEARLKEQILALELPEEGVRLALPAPVIELRKDEGDPGGVKLFSYTGAISGIANKFNNKERGRQFRAKIIAEQQNEALIATKFNNDIVQQITGLKDEEKLNEFMKFCVLADDFLVKANNYEIHEAVLGCFKDFMASK